jgi:hypothetical protein
MEKSPVHGGVHNLWPNNTVRRNARMKIGRPVLGLVVSAILLLLGSVGLIVASQGSLDLDFAPPWRQVLWCSSLVLEAISFIGVFTSLIACMKIARSDLPVFAFVASAMLLLLGSIGHVVADQGSVKLTFAPLWRIGLSCAFDAVGQVSLIGVLFSLLWWIATAVEARSKGKTTCTASSTVRSFWPLTIVATGLFLWLSGFNYVHFHSIPYCGPTPEQSARYADYACIASSICWLGFGFVLLGSLVGITRFVVRRFRPPFIS